MALDSDFDVLRVLFPAIHDNPDLKPSQLSSNVFGISFPLLPSQPRHVQSFDIGPMGPSITAVLRITREKVYWLMPSLDRNLPSHVDTQVLFLKFPTSKVNMERVACILPLTTGQYMGTLRGQSSSVAVRFESDQTTQANQVDDGMVIVAVAPHIKDATSLAVDGARKKLGITSLSNISPERHIFSNTLTYCTWNSLHPPTPATQTSVFRTLEGFANLSPPVRPTSLLLDDAWQDKDPVTMRLLSFKVLPYFLDGMADLGEIVRRAKSEFGVQRVGVWHTIQGYWCGVEPRTFGRQYKLLKVVKDGYPGPFEAEGFTYYTLHPSSVGSFFMDYYREVASHGVEFTKCDNMASLDNLNEANEVDFTFHDDGSWSESIGPAVNLATIRVAFKEAVQAAAKSALGTPEPGRGDEEGRVIWCMEMTPRVLIGKEIGLRDGSRRCVVRNSDDYYPMNPDSHRHHIFTNSVNAMFTSQLNIIPDLDMFQSHAFIAPSEDSAAHKEVLLSDANHSQASYHAALRAFGAGPVTITDSPGASDPRVLQKLLGRPLASSTSDRSIALQPNQSSWVSNDIFDTELLGVGQGRALRLFSRAEGLGANKGMIGYWNIRSGNGQVQDWVTPQDVWQIIGASTVDRTFVLRSHHTGSIYTATFPANKEPHEVKMPTTPILLDAFQFDIITLSLVEDGVATLGLIDKYNSLAGLHALRREGGRRHASLKCCGELAIFVEKTLHEKVKISVSEEGGYRSLDSFDSVSAMGHLDGTIITVTVLETSASLDVDILVDA